MTEQNIPLLEVEDLAVEFATPDGVVRAVDGLSYSVTAGRTLAIVGESGSGKSVSSLAVMGLLQIPPARIVRGAVRFKGEDLLTLSPKEHRAVCGAHIAMVFQDALTALNPVHTVGWQLTEALRARRKMSRREAAGRAVELLDMVKVPNAKERIKDYPHQFSGGMRQRVMIASALAMDPEVLIADEPTTALDVTTQAEILDLIKRLQVSRGMAMLLITHDMGVVAEVADAVAVMRYGRIVEAGSAEDIFHDARHPYTVRLLNSTVKLEQNQRTAARAETSTQARQPVLSVRNLSKVYGASTAWFGGNSHALKAVDDVSLDLYPGENLGIVGESGSGKTTLGRLILRTVEPSAGTVTYHGAGAPMDVTGLSKQGLKAFHRDVRLVFQDPFASLNPRMTVKEIIGDPLYVSGKMRGGAIEARVAELLTLVGLDPMAMERYPHAFSGGQRQRIGIARALALDPKIIIADEATAALDVSIRAQILDLLLDIQQKLGLSFIFISHDISVVRYFCDRVAVMRLGKLVEVGTAEQICTQPQHPYTQSLISAVPNPDPRNKRMLHRTRYVA